MKIAIAQLNPTVGDIDANADKALNARADAARLGADLVVFPELFLAGYPPEDLVLKPSFQQSCKDALLSLAQRTGGEDGPALLVGTVWPEDGKVYNAVALIEGGEVTALRYKVELPNYGVFDEKRVFDSGPMPGPINFRGIRIGVPICEDIWIEDVVECLSECGAELIIVPNGSPFDWTKPDLRLNIAVARVIESDLPVVYVNQVGGQDELVFDGASFVLNADRQLAAQLPGWREAIQLTHWEKEPDGWRCRRGEQARLSEADEAAYSACVLGLHDYVEKNGFPGVVMGLSGGIDSALVAAMAVDALGPERVHCVMLPYRYTSKDSLRDAEACAKALGVRYDVVPVGAAVGGFLEALGPLFQGREADVTEENIQSRARGTILMALSNKFGTMLLTTGNKSEMSVGYATLYGDMNGGFNPIKDLYKTEVYRIARWRNANTVEFGKGPAGVVIPEHILTKAPSAELRENQTDQDSLPPYDVLDDILVCLVEKEMAVSEIAQHGHDLETIKSVERLLYISEYKRRQAAPGVKISARNFGRDRRYPITNRYRDAHLPGELPPVEGEAPKLVPPREDGDPG